MSWSAPRTITAAQIVTAGGAATSGFIDLDVGILTGVENTVEGVKLRVITAGVGVTTLTAAVGKSGSTTKYLAAKDCKAAAGTEYSTLGVADGNETKQQALRVTFTSTGANLDQLSAGKIAIWIKRDTQKEVEANGS